MAVDKKPEGQFYLPPPKLGKWEGFALFMWNSERREFMGRTGASWAKIGIFYLLFYALLAGFFTIMMVIFYQTLDYVKPKWTLERSIIGKNPGLGFRPMPPETNIESTLIWYKSSSKSRDFWVQSLEKFVNKYDVPTSQSGQHFKACSWNDPSTDDQNCRFDVTKGDGFPNCHIGNNFSYPEGKPCILIKLNRIFGWKPNLYFANETRDNLPKDMPEQLLTYMADHKDQANVWLTCEGENPGDKENIGPLVYEPRPGFPYYYFPYKNVPGYLSPFVMVYFQNPERGVLINVECKAWARNIIHSRNERRGSVHFELLVD